MSGYRKISHPMSSSLTSKGDLRHTMVKGARPVMVLTKLRSKYSFATGPYNLLWNSVYQ